MSAEEPSYPQDAQVSEGNKLNETLSHAVTAKEAEEKAGSANRKVSTKYLVRGAAIGVGSAALVAALLYANRSRRPGKD